MPEVMCPICNSHVTITSNESQYIHIYNCPVCGRFEYYPLVSDFHSFPINKLKAFLAYNNYPCLPLEVRYFSFRSKESCSKLKNLYESGNLSGGYPVHLDLVDVNNWYPDTFSQKIDQILLWLDSKSSYWGQTIKYSKEEALSHFFIENSFPDLKTSEVEDITRRQFHYIIDYLVSQSFINAPTSWTGGTYDRPIVLSPSGYARIDHLLKSRTDMKTAFVAMQFGEDTKSLREAIRMGIQTSGYIATFIDEVEHNDFITPELLKYIRDAKFVVVDLTHKNNGAYFEEGYALGIGKPVIQLCKKDSPLHFDIAQKNTIMWNTESDIPERLSKRIIATIE